MLFVNACFYFIFFWLFYISFLSFCLWTTEEAIEVGMTSMLIIFFLSLFLWVFFDQTFLNFQFYGEFYDFYNSYYKEWDVTAIIGVDGISLFFIILTTFISPIVLLSATPHIYFLKNIFIGLIVSIELLLLLSFCVLDMFLFFCFFESILLPMYIIIVVWGTRQRKIKAAYYFVFYTIVTSFGFLFSLFIFLLDFGTTTSVGNFFYSFSLIKQIILFLGFFLTFMNKIPTFPFYLWLPEAHVEAPTSGSIILAALLLKLGGYGIIRFLLPVTGLAIKYLLPIIFLFLLFSIFYCSITAIRSSDLKKIIAYSSVAHMNFGLLGLFSHTIQGLQGGLFLLLGHGLISTALFFVVGLLYDRYHTRNLQYFNGLSQTMPLFSIFFFIFSLANMAFPLTFNFVSEFLILIGIVSVSFWLFFLFLFVMLFSTIFCMWTFSRVCFGRICFGHSFFIDITFREFSVLIVLLLLVIFFGIQPSAVLNTSYSIFTFYLNFVNYI